MTTAALDNLLTTIWNQLSEAASGPGSPFRTAVLATTTGAASAIRTVVIRDFERKTHRLYCHTDRCSAKSHHISTRPHTEWLFHDSGTQVQVRVAGPTQILTDGERVQKLWNDAPARARQGYLVQHAPGTCLPERATGLPAQLIDRYPSQEESEAGRQNFAVVECHIESVDWLELATYGHARAQFHWQPDGTWKANWVVP